MGLRCNIKAPKSPTPALNASLVINHYYCRRGNSAPGGIGVGSGEDEGRVTRSEKVRRRYPSRRLENEVA